MQIINSSNLKHEELPSLHDGVFEGFRYKESKHIISICTKLYHEDITFYIEFINVFGFEMQCCDTWGYSPNIHFCFIEDTDENSVTQKLKNQITDEDIRKKLMKAIEFEIGFTSGNTLRISCEEVHISELDSDK